MIGILGEFDALSGLSQKAGSTVREPANRKDDAGHGCGHNMLGAGDLAAAFAVTLLALKYATNTLLIYLHL